MSSNLNFKTLFKYSASHIVGHKTDVILEGCPTRMNIIRDVLHASRVLYEVLKASESSMDDVILALEKKQEAAKNFKDHFNHIWPL